MALKFSSTQAQNAGRIIHEWRPAWDPQGIMAALSKAAISHKLGPTLTAAQRAAEDPAARTPLTILWDKYWTPEVTKARESGTRLCVECVARFPVDEMTHTGVGWVCDGH